MDDAGPAGRPQRCRSRDHAGWPAARRRPERRRAGRHDLQDAAQLPGRARGVVAGAAAQHAAGRCDRRRWSVTTCGCTAAATPTGRPPRSSAAHSARRPPRGCPPTPTWASSSAGTSTPRPTCRSPRTNASGWAANGAIYLAGGNDGGGPKNELYWAVPTNAGDLPEWKHLAASDLPTPARGRRRRSSPAPRRSSSAVSQPRLRPRRPPPSRRPRVDPRPWPAHPPRPRAPHRPCPPGGAWSRPASGPTRRRSARSSSSAWSGRPCPGMKIEGEIGQQLGYLNAAGVGTVDFILLILIGWRSPTRPRPGRSSGASSTAARAAAEVAPRPARPLRPAANEGAEVSPQPGRSPSPGSSGPRRTGSPARSHASIPPATLTTSVRPARSR